MKLSIGFLIEKCIGACSYSDYINMEELSIYDVRILNKNNKYRDELIYVDLFGYAGEKDLFDSQRPIVIMHEKQVLSCNSNIAYIAVPNKKNLFDIYDKICDLFEEFNQWYLNLYKASALGCELQYLLNLSEGMTENHIYIADMSFKVVAYTKKEIMKEISPNWRYQIKYGYLPLKTMNGLIESGELEKINKAKKAAVFYSENFAIPFICKNIYINKRPQAHLFIVNVVKRPSRNDFMIAEILADFLMDNHWLSQEYGVNRSGNFYEAFMNDVLNEKVTESSIIEEQIKIFDWKIEDDYCMAVILFDNKSESSRNTVILDFEENNGLKIFIYKNNIIILLHNPKSQEDKTKLILEKISNKFMTQACMGEIYKNFLSIKKQYDRLIKTIEIAQKIDLNRKFYEAEKYNVYFIADYINNHYGFHNGCLYEAQILKEFDKNNDTNYFDTLFTYLICDRNVLKAASELFIHRNTLMYRLRKIHKIVHLEEDANARIYFLLSMYMIKCHELER